MLVNKTILVKYFELKKTEMILRYCIKYRVCILDKMAIGKNGYMGLMSHFDIEAFITNCKAHAELVPARFKSTNLQLAEEMQNVYNLLKAENENCRTDKKAHLGIETNET